MTGPILSSWAHDIPWISVDTETTSVNPLEASIVTACVADCGRAGWQPTNYVLQQDGPIPPEATAIHGITDEQAAFGTDHKVAVQRIRDKIADAWAADRAVVVYNASYDLTLINAECERWGVEPLPKPGLVIDPLILVRTAQPNSEKFMKKPARDVALQATYREIGVTAELGEGPGWNTLAVAYYRHFGVPMDGVAHGAEADARAAARLAWRLAYQLADCGSVAESIADAMRWQATEYAEDRRGFIKWAAKNGKTLDDTDTTWPIRALDVQQAA